MRILSAKNETKAKAKVMLYQEQKEDFKCKLSYDQIQENKSNINHCMAKYYQDMTEIEIQTYKRAKDLHDEDLAKVFEKKNRIKVK